MRAGITSPVPWLPGDAPVELRHRFVSSGRLRVHGIRSCREAAVVQHLQFGLLDRANGTQSVRSGRMPAAACYCTIMRSKIHWLLATRVVGRWTLAGTITALVRLSLFEMQPGFLLSISEKHDGRRWVRKSQGVWRSLRLRIQLIAASRLQDRGGFHL